MKSYAVIVHGGCGRWDGVDHRVALRGVRNAIAAARKVLSHGGSALDAVCAAVVVLEDDPLYNAGTGAVLNRDGEAELDASVMTGHDLRCGGVAALPRVRNPVLVARAVMERTPHALLAGEGALQFARLHGYEDYDPVTSERRARYAREHSEGGPPGTVGAVALDMHGNLAAATSTGGLWGKLPGRVGDSPIAGAGNYATREAAASATGHGELMMRALATKTLCDWVAQGKTPQTAARLTIAALPPEKQEAALIALDRRGRVGVAARHGTMPHAWYVAGERIVARMRVA